MDKIDNSILNLLQENARIANSDIAKQLKMAPSAIGERIKKLEEKNIIKKYSIVLDPQAMNLNILAFTTISLNSPNWTESLSKEMLSIPNIEELHEVIGEDSYLAKIRAKDMNELSDILKNKVGIIPEVKSTKTTIAINNLKENSLYQST